MPDFRRPEISQAFHPQHFITCENQGFNGGCPAMDFPTAVEGIVATHTDPTPLPSAEAHAAAFGAPAVSVTAPPSATLISSATGVTTVPFSVSNTGTWIAPFRIRTTADWLIVRHPGDPVTRSLDGGVAIGIGTEVVTQGPSAGPPARPRLAQPGYTSNLVIAADTSKFDASDSRSATVWIEPILGGAPVSIAVTLEGPVGGGPPLPEMPHKAILPWVSSEPTN